MNSNKHWCTENIFSRVASLSTSMLPVEDPKNILIPATFLDLF
jgi:hypothetical protein